MYDSFYFCLSIVLNSELILFAMLLYASSSLLMAVSIFFEMSKYLSCSYCFVSVNMRSSSSRAVILSCLSSCCYDLNTLIAGLHVLCRRVSLTSVVAISMANASLSRFICLFLFRIFVDFLLFLLRANLCCHFNACAKLSCPCVIFMAGFSFNSIGCSSTWQCFALYDFIYFYCGNCYGQCVSF